METKKYIKSMANLVDLFLAIYSVNLDRTDDKVYFSKNIKSLIKQAISESYSELIKLNCYQELVGEEDMIDIDEFMNKLLISQTKKYWRDSYHFDIQKGIVYTEVTTEDANAIIEKYNEEDVNIIDELVQNYVLFQHGCENKLEGVSINIPNRKYTMLLELKRSND